MKKINLDREKITLLLLSILIGSYIFGLMLIANISIGLHFIFWFTRPNVKEEVKKILSTPVFWSLSAVFWLSLIGLLYTENIGDGLKYIEGKLSLILLIFPLCSFDINIKSREILMRVFVLSILFGGALGFANGYLHYLSGGDDTGYFYNDFLVYPLKNQAVYFSIYVNFALIFTIHFLINSNKNKVKYVYGFSLIFLFVIQVFLASRLSLIMSAIILFSTLVLFVKRTKKYGFSSIFVLILSILVLINLSPKTWNRFQSLFDTDYNIESVQEEYHFNKENQDNNWNGLTIRLAIWDSAIDVIKENLLMGVGTGDYKKELRKAYEKSGFNYGLEKNYGIHSLYLYMLFTFGIIGLLIFLLSNGYLILTALNKKNYLFIVVSVIFLVACLTENIFNRYIGVVFYSFITPLVFNQRDS